MSRVSYLPCLSWKLVPSLFGVYEPARAAVAACYTGDASKTRLSKINSVAPTTLRLSSTVIIMGLCLRGLRQGRAIISCELFNSLAGQLMLNVKALPWLVEIKLLIEDRLAVCGVFEIAVGHRKVVASPRRFRRCRRGGLRTATHRPALWRPSWRRKQRRPAPARSTASCSP